MVKNTGVKNGPHQEPVKRPLATQYKSSLKNKSITTKKKLNNNMVEEESVNAEKLNRCERCGKTGPKADKWFKSKETGDVICDECFDKYIKKSIPAETKGYNRNHPEDLKKAQELIKKEEFEKKFLEVKKIEYGEDRIKNLEDIAVLILVISIVAGFFIIVGFGVTSVEKTSYDYYLGYTTHTEYTVNPLGVISGVVLFLEGIVVYALFRVIASINRNLIEIRKNTEKK